MGSGRRFLLLAILVLCLLLPGLGATPLTDVDEGANAEAAREMLERGSWLTPTLNYEPRFQKPVLGYWLMALAYAGLGVGEAAARLPSALATVGLILLQYRFARWAFSASIALRAALVLTLTLAVVVIGRMVLTDALLTLWTTLAGFAFFRAHHGAPPSGRWYLVAYLALALALLTKGPVGVLVPAVGVGLYLLLFGGWRRVWQEAHLPWGTLLVVLVAGPWYALMAWEHGAPYLMRARAETLDRVFRTVTGPGGTMLFYIPVVLVGFFPWSALLPSALVAALRVARARGEGDRVLAVQAFLASWVVAVLVVFSLFRSRLPHYVAPLFPAAALLVASGWPAVMPPAARGLLATVGILLGAGLALAWLQGDLVLGLLALAYPTDAAASLPGSLLLMSASCVGLAGLAAIRDGSRAFRGMVLLTALLLGLGLHLVWPPLSDVLVAPAGRLVGRSLARLGPCDDLVIYGPYRPSLVFYARRALAFVRRPEPADLLPPRAHPGRRLILAPRALDTRLPWDQAGFGAVDALGGYVLRQGPAGRTPCNAAPSPRRTGA